MLDCRILAVDYGVSYGSVALKSLQNENMPDLDLLVREAIQNSSDASLNEKGASYTVNFKTGFFTPSRFNMFLTGIEDVLNKRYPDLELAEYLEIRDTDTSGLTGSVKKSEIAVQEDHGNFFKLIYDTGKKQTNEAAGGNWGFGKSVYYRVGIGIVIYYSRIKADDSYEDRLIVTVIEDEGKKDLENIDATILGPLTKRYAGKAWWGIESEDGDLLPLTDMEFIQPILDVFGIKKFSNNETGTSIIIPYIDSKSLLEATIPAEGGEQREDITNSFNSVFTSDLSGYLKLSIQKWYAPKIQNRKLTNLHIEDESKKWLKVYVNDEPLSYDEMFCFFKLVQELYTTALAKANGDIYHSIDFPDIQTFETDIRSYFDDGSRVGCVSVIKIIKENLYDEFQGFSPYDYIGKFGTKGNDPILMYAREPGMVINYETTGPWVHGLIRPESEDEYLLAFFIPETRKRIKNNPAYGEFAGKQLGAYLRKCEASDHNEWNDQKRMEIVKKIQFQTVKKINSISRSLLLDEPHSSSDRLSDKLGKILLPLIMSDSPSQRGGGLGGSGGSSTSSTQMFNFKSELSGQFLSLCYTLKMPAGRNLASVILYVNSESGLIDADSWYNDIGNMFPFSIEECSVNTILMCADSSLQSRNYKCNKDNVASDYDELSVKLLSDADDIYSKLMIETKVPISEIAGRILVRIFKRNYKLRINCTIE